MEKRVKIFKRRASLFDHLKQADPCFNTIYVVCKSQFVLFFLYILARDNFNGQGSSTNSNTIGGQRDWWIFAGIEFVLVLGYIFVYCTFLVWIKCWQWFGRFTNIVFMGLYAGYLYYCFCFVLTATHNISSTPKLIAFVEQLMISLKTYSFIRENAYKVMYPWHKDAEYGPAVWYGGQMSPQVGSLHHYLYFLIMPTLLYRDHYPLSRDSISWTNFFLYIVQFLGLCLIARTVFEEFQYPSSMRYNDLVEAYLRCLLCSPLVNFLISLLVLHSGCNMLGELTRFGDREFYQEWWSSFGHSEYHRRWNIVVYDFFHAYIYQDLSQYMPHRNIAVLLIFILSSILHDFYVGIVTGFFVPVVFCMYAIIGGVILLAGKKYSKSITFLSLCAGWFIFEVVTYTEIAARHYCPTNNTGYFQFQTFYCYNKYNNHSITTSNTWPQLIS